MCDRNVPICSNRTSGFPTMTMQFNSQYGHHCEVVVFDKKNNIFMVASLLFIELCSWQLIFFSNKTEPQRRLHSSYIHRISYEKCWRFRRMSKKMRFQYDLKKYEISVLTPTESVTTFFKCQKNIQVFFE